jgi:hypothetical protein
VVKVKASNLAFIDSWQVPQNQQVSDGDLDTVGEVFKQQEQQSEKFGFYGEGLPPANPVSELH